MVKLKYRLVRSKRKTLGLEINEKGLTVRAPLRISQKEIDRFIIENQEWILTKIADFELRSEQDKNIEKLTVDEINDLAERAMKYIPERVEYYAHLLGIDYGRITIRNQKTRWGSCSSKGNLNFNCLLMLTPEEVIDSVVVHELCHRLEMNHSKKFYSHVYSVYPEYDKWDKWLKKNGHSIMIRMP